MSIEFRKLTGASAAGKQEVQTPPEVIWIPPASKLQVEEQLFHFLRSVCEGHPRTTTPLLVEEATLHALYTDPHADLLVALRHCLDQFLVELSPDSACWDILELPTTVLGFALATYNCLCPPPASTAVEDPVVPFMTALLKTLPPARTLSEMLAYHSILHCTLTSLAFLSEERATWMRALLDHSMLSNITALHLHTPPPLTALGADLWPWWKSRVVQPVPWTSLEDWLQTAVLLLAQPTIAAYLRRRWLALPSTLMACRNLGLLLEALRQHGGQRAIILEFYEGFDYFRAAQATDLYHGKVRYWPLLKHIEHLLRTGGYNEAAIQTNRQGNEYFALFGPLLQIVITEHSPPRDYYHLKELIPALLPLVDYVTETPAARPQLQNIEYVSEDKS